MSELISKENIPFSVAFETLGCKLNQAETEQLSVDLTAAGCRIVPAAQAADLYILNTCTVTQIADRKSRHFIRLAHRLNPEAHIVVIGCYAERAAEEVAAIEGVDLVIGNDQKGQLIEILKSAGFIPGVSAVYKTNLHNRTRSFIKAQDGCNNACSYCIVPKVRGREKSLPPQQVIDEIKNRVEAGFKEVVLTGTEIGSYRSEGLDIQGLLERILKETSISRLRLTSLQPEEISGGLLDLWQDSRLCRHFHISLQSGSDSVLQRMNRHYTTGQYADIVDLLRRRLPESAVTTDVIAGFPGETEAEFEESFNFCRSLQFARLHIFPFSARKGTLAAGMPGLIDPIVKKERSRKMLELAESSRLEFNRRYIGRTMGVLFEQSTGGLWTGLTDNYLRVNVISKDDLTNRLILVKLLELHGDALSGEVPS
jgi:threonylcarbamoyladenosine tRNA methylthiotransferase MtaB